MVSFIHWEHPDTIRSLVVCVFFGDAPSTRKNIFSMADRQVTRVLSHFTDCQFWSWSLRWTHNLRSWIKIPSLNMVNKTIVYLSKRRCLSRTRLWEFPAYVQVPVSFLLRRYSGHQFMIYLLLVCLLLEFYLPFHRIGICAGVLGHITLVLIADTCGFLIGVSLKSRWLCRFRRRQVQRGFDICFHNESR